MRVILETAELQAYSMTMYAGWRDVIAEFVAAGAGSAAGDLVPQTVAWVMLGVALSAYEHWLADESVSLPDALGDAFDVASARRPGPLPLEGADRPRRKKVEPARRSSAADGDDRGVSAEPDHPTLRGRCWRCTTRRCRSVYGYFVRRCGDRATAEDLTSETFLAAMDAARKAAPAADIACPG